MIGAQAFGRTKIQLRPGGVNQIVVADFFLHTRLIGAGVFHAHKGCRTAGVTFRVDGQSLGLMEFDVGFGIQLGQIKSDVFFGHLTDADPDIGRNPVPFRVGRHHDHFVLFTDPLVEITGGGMTRNPRSQNNNPRHARSSPARLVIEMATWLKPRPRKNQPGQRPNKSLTGGTAAGIQTIGNVFIIFSTLYRPHTRQTYQGAT